MRVELADGELVSLRGFKLVVRCPCCEHNLLIDKAQLNVEDARKDLQGMDPRYILNMTPGHVYDADALAEDAKRHAEEIAAEILDELETEGW